MYCRNALIPKVITAGPDQTIADALKLLDEHGIRALPVVDKDTGKLLGLLSVQSVMCELAKVVGQCS